MWDLCVYHLYISLTVHIHAVFTYSVLGQHIMPACEWTWPHTDAFKFFLVLQRQPMATYRPDSALLPASGTCRSTTRLSSWSTVTPARSSALLVLPTVASVTTVWVSLAYACVCACACALPWGNLGHQRMSETSEDMPPFKSFSAQDGWMTIRKTKPLY